MAFSDWIKNPDWIPVVLFEINYGHRVDGAGWTAAGNCWWIAHPEGKPSKVESNGILLTERGTQLLCNNNPFSWYWDPAGNLYINISGDPGSGNYIILAYLWEYLTSRQFVAPDEIVFNNRWYLPYLDDTSLPDVESAIGNLLEGAGQQQFNSIDIINDGYWDSRLPHYIYEGKEAFYKLGAKGAPYADYINIATLKTGGIDWTNIRIKIDLLDQRN